MRGLVLIVATTLLVVAFVPFLASPSRAQAPIPSLSLFVDGETIAARQVFAPSLILVPQVPIELIVTFHNNDTITHTFTINDENDTVRISTGIVDPGVNVTLNFTLLSMKRILFNGTEFTPEAAGTGIRYYCIPHRVAGMVGGIDLATAQQPAQEKGILLRAYWIGIIGIAATLVWIGISYFLIKSSSRHFTDHREHVRKGLP